MVCPNCGKNVAEGYSFCPECGKKVEQTKTVDEMKAEIERLQKRMKALQNKTRLMVKKEQALYWKRNNYTYMATGIYPGLKKNPTGLQSTFIKENTKPETSKLSTIMWSYIVVAVISILAVWMPWFSIPLITEYFGGSSSNIFNTFSVACDLLNIENSIGRYFTISMQEISSIAWMLIFVCVGALIFLCTCVYLIWRCLQRISETDLKRAATHVGVYGIIMTVIVFIGVFGINSMLNEGTDYNYEFVKIEIGVWITLLASIALISLPKIIPASNGIVASKEYSLIEKSIEVTNYDPALLFRIIRMDIWQKESLKLTVECCNYDYGEIKSICADIQLLKSTDKETITNVEFYKVRNSTKLCAQFQGDRLELTDVKEAKIYVKSYRIEDIPEACKEDASGYYVDSDYQADMLKSVRMREGNVTFIKDRNINNCHLCACGQPRKVTEQKCPMCGKILSK